ncbi:hypothetical protein DNHGIG_21010 [Collibacillus ludicampi]|uniref:DUF3870 domain-containing protein n=1 Tax=Collibacillus ludicampi TaxID=2771369 RepID=A0AAV4LFI2_9BACL|nr:DUF3870 domain-containing protein [Collibacillus ludicampi]GIM46552.1 hypothetical protein DNHGIG_21010 [Collibacillus ludicampi]
MRNLPLEYDENHVLVAGFAQLPKGTTLYEVQKVIGFVMVVDRKTDTIMDASFTFVMDLTNQFISQLVKGYDLKLGMDPLVERIRNQVFVPALGAIIQAIRSAFDRYFECRNSSRMMTTVS